MHKTQLQMNQEPKYKTKNNGSARMERRGIC